MQRLARNSLFLLQTEPRPENKRSPQVKLVQSDGRILYLTTKGVAVLDGTGNVDTDMTHKINANSVLIFMSRSRRWRSMRCAAPSLAVILAAQIHGRWISSRNSNSKQRSGREVVPKKVPDTFYPQLDCERFFMRARILYKAAHLPQTTKKGQGRT